MGWLEQKLDVFGISSYFWMLLLFSVVLLVSDRFWQLLIVLVLVNNSLFFEVSSFSIAGPVQFQVEFPMASVLALASVQETQALVSALVSDQEAWPAVAGHGWP